MLQCDLTRIGSVQCQSSVVTEEGAAKLVNGKNAVLAAADGLQKVNPTDAQNARAQVLCYNPPPP